MKAQLYQNSDFFAAVQDESLVYLFGTGISAALTGEAYSWWKWILEGIHHMTDATLASRYEKSLNDDDSAGNMIDIVGKVLSATKVDGTYDAWMQESFEKNGAINQELSRTLRKLLLPQDVFATTNYDLLLERATGLGTITYEESNLAFSMLDRRVSTHILHIHGAYDSKNHIDNIIADQMQYDAVMKDQGAQFIQNILGTRTLVFVGCGKTTEDCNVSRFIQFANDHLKMDKKYYFLHRIGESTPDMPDNIICVPYGDEYTDLPLFLEEMAQARLRAHIAKNALIGRTAYETVTMVTDPLLKYHYSQQTVPFSGRTGELKRLADFVNCEGEFNWWSVTGQAGAGKSRLALEMLGRLPSTWFGFFLNDNASIKDVQNFVPFSNTVIVIDYVSGRESAVARILCELAQQFEEGTYKLRVLLLERENSRKAGSWYAKLIQRFGRFDAQKMKNAEYDSSTFLNLGDLEIEDVVRFIGSICAVHGLVPDQRRDETLCSAYAQKFEKLQFRPLFVRIFVEAWIENGCSLPRYDSFEDLLARMLEREQERWLEILSGDQACCNAFIRLLLRANISGKLDITNIPDFYRADWEKVSGFLASHFFPGRQGEVNRQSIINSICQDIDENPVMIAPLFPDIIKEYMFCFYMEKDRLPLVVSELWRNAPNSFSVFITRCLTDFPDNPFYKQALQAYDLNMTDSEVLLGRLSLLDKRIIEEHDDPVVLIDIIDNEYAFWKALPVPESEDEQTDPDRLAAVKLTGLHMVARQYGGWSYYDLSLMMEVIREMLDVKGGPATKTLKKICLQEHIRELSVAGFLEEAKLLTDRMNELLVDKEKDDWNALQMMVNSNVEMMNCIMENRFPQAMAVLKRMEKQCQYSSVEVVRVLMHSCFNMTSLAFRAVEPKYIDAALLIAEKTALLYPKDGEIASRLIGCRVQKLQYQYFGERSLSDADLDKRLREVDTALNVIPLGESANADEAFGMAWGSVRILSLNIIDKDESALRKMIREATEILNKNPQLTEVATTMIQATRALHKNVLRNKVSTGEVQNAFAYVEQNPDSETLRGAFFEMLDESEEASNRQSYFTKWVVAGARQDARYNPANSSGIPEIENEERMLRSLLGEMSSAEPYRRNRPKVGVNDPCPCGSGKKFKKCCRGNGRFD